MKIRTVLLSALLLAPFAGAQTVTVPEGTIVRLRLSQAVSSTDAHAGDAITLEVLDDVKVGDAVAFQRGAQARGTVSTAHSKRRMGRAGAVEISIDYVNATDGTRVPVSGARKSKGNNSAGMIGIGVVLTAPTPIAPLFLLMHGKDTDMPPGTPVQVFTTSEAQVDMAAAPAAPALTVPVRVVATKPEQGHVIEGYTLSGPGSGTGSVDGDQMSLGDAARAAKAKKNADKGDPQ
jgi:hypothetical protein